MSRLIKSFLLITLFIILTTYNSSNQKKVKGIFFEIKNIIIEDTNLINLVKLKTDLEFLRGTSLFFLDEKKILDVISKYDFISNMSLKKSYPNTIKIIISEKIPIAIQILGNKKFYITLEGEKLIFLDSEFYKDLPVIFGDQKNFNSFYAEINQSNFTSSEVKAFYYFDVGRWDIVLKNDKIIKLPKNNYMKILKKIDIVLTDSNFSKFKIFDYRIEGQLILK